MDALLSVLGGALALLGGFASSYLIDRIKRRYETRTALREKLEELCILVFEIQSEGIKCFNQVGQILQGNTPDHGTVPTDADPKVQKLHTITYLYFVDLLPNVEKFLKFRREYNHRLFRILVSKTRGVREEDKLSSNELGQLAQECNDILNVNISNRIDQIKESARKFASTNLLNYT